MRRHGDDWNRGDAPAGEAHWAGTCWSMVDMVRATIRAYLIRADVYTSKAIKKWLLPTRRQGDKETRSTSRSRGIGNDKKSQTDRQVRSRLLGSCTPGVLLWDREVW